jgi:hypothetical protein
MANLTKAQIDASNQSALSFKPAGVNLDWGKTEFPQTVIAPWSDEGRVFGSEGADNSASGTSGWAKWSLDGDPDTWIEVIFDSPFNGDNSASWKGSDKFNKLYAAKLMGPDTRGNCNVILKIVGR